MAGEGTSIGGLRCATMTLDAESVELRRRSRTAAVAAGHVGRRPSLIDEDEALGIKRGPTVEPVLPPLHDVRPVLLADVRGLFLRVVPCRARNRRIVPWPIWARLGRNSSIVASGVSFSIARIVC